MHRDRRSLADDALGAHRTAVRLDQVAHDGQAESGAAFVARRAGVDAIEALEDSAEVLGRDSGAGVASRVTVVPPFARRFGAAP